MSVIFVRRDAAAAEDADVGELVEIGQSDLPGLHAAHGQAGHGAIRLVGERAEIGVDEGNQIVDEHALERAEVEVRPPAGPAADTWPPAGRRAGPAAATPGT